MTAASPCRGLSENAFAMVRGAPADPLFEGVGEGEGAFEADLAGDDLHLVVGGGEQVHRFLEAEEGELLAGAATDLLAAKPAQVFIADAGECGEFLEGPRVLQVGFRHLPHPPEAVVRDMGSGEAQDVVMDQLGPVMEGGRPAATADDPDGSVAKVEFFAGTTKLGEDPTAPPAAGGG